MTVPFYRNTNQYRRMEHRLRKSWGSLGSVIRPTIESQFGKLSEWAQNQGSIEYAVEIETNSVDVLVDFLNSISTIIRNQEEIEWNPLDESCKKAINIKNFRVIIILKIKIFNF